jgi:hypothetical protein
MHRVKENTLHNPNPQGNKFHAGNLHTKAYISWLTLTALNTSKDSLQQQSTKGHTPFVTNSHNMSRRKISLGIYIAFDRHMPSANTEKLIALYNFSHTETINQQQTASMIKPCKQLMPITPD